MSRQYDEAHGDDIEFNGERLHAIEPRSFEHFLEAVKMKDRMTYFLGTLQHDENSDEIYSLLEEQEAYLREYIENLGSYDNRVFKANIEYLCRKYNIRIGELERYAGISAGYISRTIGDNSQKKMSVDIAWKLAKLFNVSIMDLIGSKMEDIKGNTALLLQFLDKLIDQTEAGEHEWQDLGGAHTELSEYFDDTGLFTDVDDLCEYTPKHLNGTTRWFLWNSVMACKDFYDEDCGDLIIIPYFNMRGDETQYDLIIAYDNRNLAGYETNTLTIDKILYTTDSTYFGLREKAEKLYKTIRSMESDAKLSDDMRFIIKGYLKQKG